MRWSRGDFAKGRSNTILVGSELVAGLALLVSVVDTDAAVEARLAPGVGIVAVTVAVIALTIRRPSAAPGRVFAAFLTLALGTAASSAGLGLALGGLVGQGLSAAFAFGFVALAAGIFVVAASAVWLLRPLPRWWRLVGIPGGIVVAQFWLLPLFMAMLGTHPPHLTFGDPLPAGAERVAFTAADGVTLAGWFTPSTNGATVIVLPGAGGTKANVTDQAAVLERHGYGVLAYDPRGIGESGGHGMLWGWGGDRDLSAAVTYLASRADVDPLRVGALGLSMGGEVAMTGGAADARLRAVVAEGATGRTCADLWFLPGDVEGSIHRADSCFGWSIAGLMTGAPEPGPLTDAVLALTASRPLLLIAADLPEEHAATEAWRALSPTVQLWEPTGASHTGAISAYPAEWESRVITFLDGALG